MKFDMQEYIVKEYAKRTQQAIAEKNLEEAFVKSVKLDGLQRYYNDTGHGGGGWTKDSRGGWCKYDDVVRWLIENGWITFPDTP